jgi:peptidoglycan hydrolase CwlO-like protein
MMFKRLLICGLIVGVATIIVLFPGRVRGVSCEDSCDGKSDADKITCLQDVSNACQDKIKETHGQAVTLQSLITYLNNKIKGTQAQINQKQAEITVLQNEINGLSGKIAALDLSLEQLTALLVNRIQAMYKHETTVNPLVLLFSSTGINDFFSRLRYFKLIQEHDRRIIIETERVRTDFDLQKQVKEQKQVEVEALQARLQKEKTTLARQQTEKNQLLQITKNDEKKYQQLLAQAYTELQAIQSAVAGKGTETEVGKINTGDSIASIIVGESVCSTGTHTHFEVVKNKANYNPADYLKSVDVQWDLCGWWGCDEPFGFSGSFEWPINQSIRITQGYGMTAYAKAGHYGGGPHTGIDMTSDNHTVKSVKEGTLYRGSYIVPSGCKINGTLRYVKVDHSDGLSTYYFHVNYI